MFELFLIAVVVSVVASIGWYVLIAVGVMKLVSSSARGFEAQLREAERMARQLPGAAGSGRSALQAHLMQRLLQVNSQWGQLRDLDRQRYDVRMSELSGYAAANGLDWTPPSW